MHTNIHIQIYTYILAYMHEFIHKNSYIKTSSLYSIDHRQWENDIHSFRIFLQCLFKSTTTQRHSRPQQLTLCRSLHAKVLQATVSEGLAQGPWRCGQNGIRPHDLPMYAEC